MTFFLVRHAAHDDVGGFLAGRAEDIRLGPEGLAQAERLGARMAHETFSAIYASPRERARQTADAIAGAHGEMPVETAEPLDEVDFGPWSGQRFEYLDADPLWRQWNSARSMTRAPGGETMLDVQQRVLGLMEKLSRGVEEGRLVLVSHADVIKAAVMHVLGLSIDAWPRFDIAPASITILVTGTWGAKLVTLNETIA
jgi:broad specificity phosphatase PhoE